MTGFTSFLVGAPIAALVVVGGSGTRNAQTAWTSVFRYLKMRPWLEHWLFVDRSAERFDQESRLIDEATRDQLRTVVTSFATYCARFPRTRAS